MISLKRIENFVLGYTLKVEANFREKKKKVLKPYVPAK
tara:strand:- start:1627 stop:1740 length:114 start_codon:yes stop_codon:yes gene_type:complete